MERLPFNKSFLVGKELEYVTDAARRGGLSGDGRYTKLCSQWLEKFLRVEKALLTHSCTAALEMSALLAGIEPGDEVIVPSFTFVSTANAFVLRGGIPVFVDIRPDTLNLDENQIESAISRKTKAIVPVHYAGVACEMDSILQISRAHRLVVIEDAAQAIQSKYKGRPLGSFGDTATLSFHETKNISSGEGGALLINDSKLIERALILRDKGTNRHHFLSGATDKYTWLDIGSSFLPSELTAAFLYSQLEESDRILKHRARIWRRYFEGFSRLEEKGLCRRPTIPKECEHNSHLFYLLLADPKRRPAVRQKLNSKGIATPFHYVPLHSSPAGRRYGRTPRPMPQTDRAADSLIRLPSWNGMTDAMVDRVIECVNQVITDIARTGRRVSKKREVPFLDHFQ